MKKVLIIAYYFPPMGGGGVQRVLKFVKYLVDFNYQPVVLSASAPFETTDETLIQDIPAGVKVFRTKGWNVYRPLDIMRNLLKRPMKNNSPSPAVHAPAAPLETIITWKDQIKALVSPFPDSQIGWIASALPAGLRIIKDEKIDLIYATTSPNSGLVLGSILKRMTGKPLVLDYRDPWIQWYFMEKWEKIRWRYRLEKALERRVVRTADKILNVNRPLQEKHQSEFPEISSDKFSILSNGFDREDFKDLRPAERKRGRFRLLYFGKFYAKRSPLPFLTALLHIIREDPVIREKVEVLFLGEYDEPGSSVNMDFNMVYGLTDIVKVLGYRPHREALSEALAADALLFIVGRQYQSESITTGKIFEYMALSKPIFACVPEGISREIILRSKLGVVTSSDDPEQIKSDLKEFIRTYTNDSLTFQPDHDVVDQFDRKKLTFRLSGIFDSVLHQSRHAD